jgi:hypothetical protein
LIEEHAQHEDQQHHGEQETGLREPVMRDQLHHLRGNAQLGQRMAEQRSGREDQEQHRRTARGVDRRVPDVAQAQAAIDQAGDGQRAERTRGGGLGGGEHAQVHAAQHQNGQRQRPERLAQRA